MEGSKDLVNKFFNRSLLVPKTKVTLIYLQKSLELNLNTFLQMAKKDIQVTSIQKCTIG